MTMRVPRLAVTLALGLGLVGAAALVAAPATPALAASNTSGANPAMPGMDMNMPGMNMPAATTAPKQDRSYGIQRARLKPVFLEAKLEGRNEVQVPGKPPVGDPKGSATGLIRVQGNRVTFAFSWKGISAPTLGHIHQGVFGVNGPVVVPLFASPVPATVVAISGTVTGVDPALVSDISAHPSAYYTNLHTAQFPGGAVRGQLFRR